MPQIIRYCRLPYSFDSPLLAEEAITIAAAWIPHYNSYDYTGDWSGIPLRSPGGQINSMLAESAVDFADTPHLEQSPAMRQAIEMLPGAKMAARLLKLSRGAVIREHRDRELAFEQGEIRLHIPLVTHPEVEFWLDGDRLNMLPGECWYINANLPHRLSNPSPVDRIHLVVDIRVDEAVKKVFGNIPANNKSTKVATEDIELKKRTISELLLNPDPRMQELAKKLQQELASGGS